MQSLIAAQAPIAIGVEAGNRPVWREYLGFEIRRTVHARDTVDLHRITMHGWNTDFDRVPFVENIQQIVAQCHDDDFSP
jgi:hypothetical protein